MAFSSDPINTLENLYAKNKTKSISIYLAILLATITILFLLPIIKVDISSQSRGIIRSTTDNVPITTIVNGRITWINLKNNTQITQGDTLLKIAKESLETEKKVQNDLSGTAFQISEDLSNVLQGKTSNLKTSSIREEYNKFKAQKDELQNKFAQAEINYTRNKLLFDKGIIAKVEYEKYFYEFESSKHSLNSFIKSQKSTWENQKRDLEEQIKNLKGSVSKLNVEENNYVVIAPTSGTIENFSGLQIGSFLNASQQIATISPIDDLIVESSVSPDDIGLIRKNQKVKFQMDAFNYNQWGLLEGVVTDIDKNITLQEDIAYFKVRCKLNSKEMLLKSGYKAEVSKGMTLTTRYLITRRSLFDLLFDKVDDWINPKSISK